jgi:hypothetical protein
MRLTRGRSASASGGLSAEAAAADAGGVTVGVDSGGGGAEVAGGDGGATKDDGGTVVSELEEEDSAFVDLDLLPPFLACAEEAANSATNETMPMNFGDIKNGSVLCGGPTGEPSLKKVERLVQ